MDLALLYCYNCDHEFSVILAFVAEWIANFPIFGRKKCTVILTTAAPFLPREAMLALLSCLSVRPSQAGIVPKWLNIGQRERTLRKGITPIELATLKKGKKLDHTNNAIR